jgi:hypothetical protein
MFISDDIDFIFEHFDFTESIVEEMYWEKNLLDFSIVVDYWWTEKNEKVKYYKIKFVHCKSMEMRMFQNFNLTPREEIKEAHIASWFTIVFFIEDEKFQDDHYRKFHIFTSDHEQPWLTVVCAGIELEDVTKFYVP